MTAALRVIQSGLHTTVQDRGRLRHQRFGIPVSGALDWVALQVANIIVGNEPGEAALEMAVLGPVLEVVSASARVALAGGGAGLQIERSDGGRQDVAALQSVRVMAGDRLRVTALNGSAVAYLAIEGGLDVPLFLGSRSTYVRGGFGGHHGRALIAGDELALRAAEAETRAEQRLDGFDLAPATHIRVVPGPQDDYFSSDAIATFLREPYTVTRDADRMGLRLEGPALAHAKGYNIVSDGIAPGSIQVPGSGQPIVLLADRQTTGGYPKIATVISADLPALGRVLPGMTLQFEAVAIEAAEAARAALEAALAALPGQLQAVSPDGPDLERLYDSNLISGVLDGCDPRITCE